MNKFRNMIGWAHRPGPETREAANSAQMSRAELCDLFDQDLQAANRRMARFKGIMPKEVK